LVTRILQAFRPITDSSGKEYRLPREILLIPSGSSLLGGSPVLGQISAAFQILPAKPRFLFRSHRRYSGPPGHQANTDDLGKEY
jgi:hypothetical protein